MPPWSQSKSTMTTAKHGFIPHSSLNTVRIRWLESLLLLASKGDLKLFNSIYILTYLKIPRYSLPRVYLLF